MSATAPASRVLISEVGPRDGLQNAHAIMPTEAKRRWITALAAAGLSEIEVGSFVRPDRVPQLADTAEVVAHALTLPGLTVAVLAPNARGAERAIAAGVHKITVPVSASRAHALANVGMTPEQSVEALRAIAALRDAAPEGHRPTIEGGLSTAFGCTLQGAVPEDDVVRLAVAMVEAGADEVGLSDTTGMGNPSQVKRLVRAVRAAIGHRLSGVHLHDTRGLALANAFAAWEEGIGTFDGSLAGLGGCPFAPGASGNAVTEDLVSMFHDLGVATGIDLDRLIAARAILAEALPGEALHGAAAKWRSARVAA
ncbi:hydroxymethylglutaryl-CoA lyase [Elioraea sp.]|uniref:hydroxymethylglutaryl-CoA lyase n=1 Tax=Elioraea sp. TaxID=2185103 RepID=UPI0025C6D662|nr:hydroxymethylglutaryl-CoA lyase [Elioraea sp.]